VRSHDLQLRAYAKREEHEREQKKKRISKALADRKKAALLDAHVPETNQTDDLDEDECVSREGSDADEEPKANGPEPPTRSEPQPVKAQPAPKQIMPSSVAISRKLSAVEEEDPEDEYSDLVASFPLTAPNLGLMGGTPVLRSQLASTDEDDLD